MVNSTNEFLAIIKSTLANGIMSSLDVESLFTNIPLIETIEIIIHYCYNHQSIESPKISKHLLKELIILCTPNAPFRHMKGKLFYQEEGIAIGSHLEPTFAIFYMRYIENEVLKNLTIKPLIYTRYVDNIFVVVENENQLQVLKKQVSR